ncbi:unnamed protein product [Rotaria magnacalcarata]|uniref:Uncharacterized protein n=1 Tax=Rotaria magnacalcarata TaxID=392030 RepID=A0A816UQU2_9BILA|nr:unnamed protein product [Rotaria magnacalcarata]CAF3953524.1 unnamed protein product [Rotaria magnacalcarata]
MAEAVTEKPLEEELRQCNETYGTENFTTDKTVRSEIHEESSYIGIHASLDKTIKFIPSDGTVQAGVSGVDERVPVELPEISSEYNSSSATIKVKQLLRNFHFCPIYEKKSSRKVSFRLTSPQDKTWEKQDNILSLPDHSVWICRRNNTISYAYANTVTTWDWSNNTFALTSYPTTKITALAENVEADLVVGYISKRINKERISSILSTTTVSSEESTCTAPKQLCINFDDTFNDYNKENILD